MKNNQIAKAILSFSLVTLVSSCSISMLKDEPFNLNNLSENFDAPKATLLKSVTEFNLFLNDEKIFTKEPTKKFVEVNSKYDETYFLKADLIALIIQASSGMIEGYSLNGIEKDKSTYVIDLKAISSSNITSDDMGRYFCYYLEVAKDVNMIGVTIKY